MSFWAKSTGEVATATEDQEGAESGKLVQIPDGTMIMAVVTEVDMNAVRDEDFIEDVYEHDGYKLTWNIIEDGEYKGVNVKQSMRVLSQKPSQRDQALDVLAYMDLRMNGGAFMASEEQPDILELLEAFQNKPMIVKVRSMTGKHAETGAPTHNQWIAGVFSKKPEVAEAHQTKEAALAAAKGQLTKQAAAAGKGGAAGAKAGAAPLSRPESPAAKKAREAAEAAALLQREAEAEAAAEAAALRQQQDAEAARDEAARVAAELDAGTNGEHKEKYDY